MTVNEPESVDGSAMIEWETSMGLIADWESELLYSGFSKSQVSYAF